MFQFFHTPEGYVKNTPTDDGIPSFDYVYQYKDHTSARLSTGLGNIRLPATARILSRGAMIFARPRRCGFAIRAHTALTKWKTKNTDSNLKTYNYTYDALNRIKTAINTNANYNLDLVNYDKNEGGALKNSPVDYFSERASLPRGQMPSNAKVTPTPQPPLLV